MAFFVIGIDCPHGGPSPTDQCPDPVAACDQLITEVGDRLSSHLYRRDALARLGNQEVGVFAPFLRWPEDAGHIAEKILTALYSEPYPAPADGRPLQPRFTVGLATAWGRHAQPDALMADAHRAMRDALDSGAHFGCADDACPEEARRRIQLAVELCRDFSSRRLKVHFQPLVELATGRRIGGEALLRWPRRRTGEWVPPGQFIPLLERTNLITVVGEWVLRQCCLQARAWLADARPLERIAVNVAARQVEQHDFAQRVEAILQETDIPAHLLELELTETVLIRQNPVVTANLGRLRNLGISIALDDFGAGYSGLTYLKDLPVDRIKIDRSFVEGVLDTPERVGPIIDTVLGLASRLGLSVTAEGIEQPAQFDLLRHLGCPVGQGFLLGHPAPAEHLWAEEPAPFAGAYAGRR